MENLQLQRQKFQNWVTQELPVLSVFFISLVSEGHLDFYIEEKLRNKTKMCINDIVLSERGDNPTYEDI